jgi:hypothetical protein
VAAHLAVLDPPLATAYRAVATLAIARLRLHAAGRAVAKPALDSVLRALTAIPRCDSVPTDERD